MTATIKRAQGDKPAGASTPERISIAAPRLKVIRVKVEGESPYVSNKFSEEARQMMIDAQTAGQQARSKKKREPKDFEKAFLGSIHHSEEGWMGIPAPAFRAAMIDACRLVGFKMTLAKMSVFVLADGIDRGDGTPLVRITEGDPEHHQAFVRNATGVADVRSRGMWRKWSCTISIRYDEDQFSATDVVNLLNRAGLQNGVGAGRHNSKDSYGQGWGCFQVVAQETA